MKINEFSIQRPSLFSPGLTWKGWFHRLSEKISACFFHKQEQMEVTYEDVEKGLIHSDWFVRACVIEIDQKIRSLKGATIGNAQTEDPFFISNQERQNALGKIGSISRVFHKNITETEAQDILDPVCGLFKRAQNEYILCWEKKCNEYVLPIIKVSPSCEGEISAKIKEIFSGIERVFSAHSFRMTGPLYELRKFLNSLPDEIIQTFLALEEADRQLGMGSSYKNCQTGKLLMVEGKNVHNRILTELKEFYGKLPSSNVPHGTHKVWQRIRHMTQELVQARQEKARIIAEIQKFDEKF